MECICIDCPNKCYEYIDNGISDRAYYEWSIKLDKCRQKVRVNMNIFNNEERKIKCIDKYDTSPYSCDYELLEIGKEYTVTNIHVYGWFTMIELKEFPNKEFNSVLFEDLPEESEE